MVRLANNGMGTSSWSQVPSQEVAGGKHVRFWQGPWRNTFSEGFGLWGGLWGTDGTFGSYLVVGIRDTQESMEAMVGGQKGPPWPHPKMPLASHPCKVSMGS